MICEGGGPPPPPPTGAPVPELGTDATRHFTVIADSSDGLRMPRDVAFHPERPDELWTVNRTFDGVVILFDPGTPMQRADRRADAYGNHFMEEVSSMAFGASDTFATCQESRNTYNGLAPPNDFMGPTLWPADLDVFAVVNQDPRGPLGGSHLDMLHQSPLCMGIAHQSGNQYWAFDGLWGDLVFYDFRRDHGPGYDDHSDGVVRRYSEVDVRRRSGVPSNLEVDPDSSWLYIADTGNSRILRFDRASGRVAGALEPAGEPLAEYSEMSGARVEVFAGSGLMSPSGLAIHDGRLFVSDHATGQIVAYALADGSELMRVTTGAGGIMGMTAGPDGRLYFADGPAHTVVRVDP
jgi:hypothetical protein